MPHTNAMVNALHSMVLLVLFHSCVVSVSGAVSSSSSSSGRVSSFSVLVAEASTSFIGRAASQYSMFRPDLNVTVADVDPTSQLSAATAAWETLTNGHADVALIPFTPTEEQRRNTPDLAYHPFLATAVAPIYNLPDALGTLTLSMLLVSRIFTGNITRWNDPLLVALNPLLSLPNQPIEVVLQSDHRSINRLLCQIASKEDPTFSSLIATSDSPVWPYSRYAKHHNESGSDGPTSYVLSHPYSISIAVVNIAKKLGASISSLKNSFGNVVKPTYDSIQSGLNEGVVSSSLNSTGQTVFTSSGDYVALTLSEVDLQLGIDASLTGIHCASGLEIDTGYYEPITIGGAGATTTHTAIRYLLLDTYAKIDGVADYVFQEMDEYHALEQVLKPNTLPDLIWFFPLAMNVMYPHAKEHFLAGGFLQVAHLAMYGVVPRFTLPKSVVTAISGTKNVHPPMLIDMETLAAVFLGDITSWLDTRITQRNPSLTSAAFAGADPTITLVLCGKGNLADASKFPISNHLMITLNGTNAFQSSGIQFGLPADWSPVIARLTANGGKYVLVDHEIQMDDAIIITPGSIGYIVGYRPTSVASTDFQIVKKVQSLNSATLIDYIVAPNMDNILKSTELTEPTEDEQFAIEAARSTAYEYRDVWPFPLLMSIGVPTDVRATSDLAVTSATLCFRQTRAIGFASYVTTDLSIEVPSERAGRGAMAKFPQWRAFFQELLRELKCEGEPVLYKTPLYWTIPDWVYRFTVVTAAIGIAFAVLFGFGVVLYRHRTIIRSAHLPNQLISLVGLICILISAILFVHTPTAAICTAFGWLLPLGVSLGFFAISFKVIRIYRRYSQRRGVKRRFRMNDDKLAKVSIFWASLHVIVLSVAQGMEGGLFSVETINDRQDERDHFYSQCNISSGAVPYGLIILIGDGAVLLIAGLFALGVRHLSSAFNESRHISWSVWNTIISTGIIVPIIQITGGMQGDVGIFLIAVVLLWCSLSTMLFTFAWKFASIAREEWETRRANLSTSSAGSASNRTTQSGSSDTGSSDVFNLPSLDNVSLTILEKYITVIETQIRMAREKRKQIFGTDSLVPVGGCDDDDATTGANIPSTRRAAEESSVLSQDGSLGGPTQPIRPLGPAGLRIALPVQERRRLYTGGPISPPPVRQPIRVHPVANNAYRINKISDANRRLS